MRSNYKKLGNYIRQVNIKNTDGKVDMLVGVNLEKKFIPSVANIVGTDLTKYKVIKKGQFGCKLMSVGRDGKLPISLMKDYEKAIISSAYYVFEVKNENELLSDYLMMWLSRSENDRYLWFKSGADVRGSISWNDFCSIEINIPSIEKQREIVAEYYAITNRIKLNEQLNQKLEETAQSIYKEWFVDFEFPDENDKPYKSNGGEMVWCEELRKEIPKGWGIVSLDEVLTIKYGKDYKNLENGNIPLYGSGGIMGYVNDHLYSGKAILIPRKGSLNNIIYLNQSFWTVDTMFYSIVKSSSYNQYLFHILKSMDFYSLNVGSAVPSMTTKLLNSLRILKPQSTVLDNFEKNITTFFDYKNEKVKEINILELLKEILLSKMATVEG
ncbi:restriction endonuclease subunit S [Francisella philomiragia]|uniref:restriction endonuclease subunit S n=1 Tax=Francisella philomiragia TaxID=28110 RepID=UPI001905C5CB|nr:restriction endonuclease subunit S [Francisella philomiragia]MBK2266887.1 restriction endonuclease subunit S [Francisella philomiragia]MBK2277944.1 restriction endonuclease subunit S [Francisella philomiragia]MBK2285801.1 restriction endonuclease subunit S [Francisella philomiragia]MBK2288171.1 restriction endonuclease subunit S [Francisella philomiragia]MBK2289759.1 restriction endonuclease subunit S [Francisella philomiragia]